MSSYLTVSAFAQTVDAAQQVSSLLKYVLPSFEVGTVQLQTFRLQAATPLTISVPPLGYIAMLAVRGTVPVDVSLKNSSGPVYTGYASRFYLRCWQPGVLVDHLILLSAVAGEVEVAIAGRLTP